MKLSLYCRFLIGLRRFLAGRHYEYFYATNSTLIEILSKMLCRRQYHSVEFLNLRQEGIVEYWWCPYCFEYKEARLVTNRESL